MPPNSRFSLLVTTSIRNVCKHAVRAYCAKFTQAHGIVDRIDKNTHAAIGKVRDSFRRGEAVVQMQRPRAQLNGAMHMAFVKLRDQHRDWGAAACLLKRLELRDRK